MKHTSVKKTSILLIPLIALLLLSSRLFFFSPSFLETAASYFTYPVIQLSSIISSPFKKIFFTQNTSYNDLLKKHKSLKLAHEKLTREHIKLSALSKYAKKSEELRAFKNRYKLENSVLAKVLVKTLSNEEQSIIVNRGSRDGIKKNMVAIYKLQLVGRVCHVTPCYSKITLITDSQSKVSVFTNRSSARGIIEGCNEQNKCHLKYISHLNTVHDGDFVLSSGKGMVFPEGFCVGKIVNITKKDVCYNVEVSPLLDFSALEMCLLTSQEKMNLF